MRTDSSLAEDLAVAVIFPRWTNHIPLIIALLLPTGAVGATAAVWYWFSPSFTDVGYMPEQPVPYSHRLHAGELGIDCRYCHNTVEVGAHAGIPPTETCMNCHKLVLADSELIKPISDSYENGTALEWRRVHMLPDYAGFDHSVHIAAGVGCASCHGRVDKMETVVQIQPLSMGWCLSCHRNPTPHLRPQSEITNMAYEPAAEGYEPEADEDRMRMPIPPDHCSGCHQ